MVANRARATLVERFVDFKDWPTSRKTARFGVLILPALLLTAGFVVLARPKAVDVPMLEDLLLCGLVLACATIAVGWVTDRRGAEG